ncbi:MAG: cobalamin biosynthesis protein CbiD, partial [Eubacteriaceae bacterium]|nr:cobalamin biosynthesis protein CbiD [Eubacteriaceae bacterium]
RKMIHQELDKIRNELEITEGFNVEISVPEGERLAEKTFNPKLGIVGGISILGTTGIVEPMSEKALSDSIFLEMKVIKENNDGEILVFPGNYGRQYARDQLGIDVSKGVKISNYFGEMLDNINQIGYQKVLLVGHIGKLIKLAGGIMNTHSYQSDGRMEILAAYSSLMGGDSSLTEKILGCVTCDEAIEHIAQAGLQDKVFDHAAKRMIYHMRNKIGNELQLGVVIFSNEYGTLAVSEHAEELMKGFR